MTQAKEQASPLGSQEVIYFGDEDGGTGAARTGKRNTVQRSLVRDAVFSLHDHPTSEEVFEQVKAKHPNISRATVYRNLNVLAETGDIIRVEIPNAADRFDFTTKPHYHAKCKRCGRVVDVDMPYLSDLIERVDDDGGFLIESHQIVFTGVCRHCS